MTSFLDPSEIRTRVITNIFSLIFNGLTVPGRKDGKKKENEETNKERRVFILITNTEDWKRSLEFHNVKETY